MRFVDTNVLIYAVSSQSGEREKRNAARELLERRDLTLSTQVLQEFYVQSTRTSRPGALTHGQATTYVDSMLRFPIQVVTLDTVRQAFRIRERYGLAYWDAAILASARLADCDIVYSEDMSADQDYDGLRVINPFVTVMDMRDGR